MYIYRVSQETKSVGTPSKEGKKTQLPHSAHSLCSRILRRLQFVGAEVVHHLLRDFCQDALSQSFLWRLKKTLKKNREHQVSISTNC